MAGKMQFSLKRHEKKYMLTSEQQENILAGMAGYMRADEFGRYTIRNIYYDTGNFQLIRASLEKPIYKEKLRMRGYGVPRSQDEVFVELKKKYDSVVYKRRTVMPAADAVTPSDTRMMTARSACAWKSPKRACCLRCPIPVPGWTRGSWISCLTAFTGRTAPDPSRPGGSAWDCP